MNLDGIPHMNSDPDLLIAFRRVQRRGPPGRSMTLDHVQSWPQAMTVCVLATNITIGICVVVYLAMKD